MGVLTGKRVERTLIGPGSMVVESKHNIVVGGWSRKTKKGTEQNHIRITYNFTFSLVTLSRLVL